MTLSKLKYLYLSTTLASFSIFFNYKFNYTKNWDMDKLMDKAMDFSSLSFGFLLAVLALLLQSDSPALKRINDSDKFQELINLNKKAVMASAILAITALFYIALKLHEAKEVIFWNMIDCHKFSDSLSIGIFTFQIVELFLFLDIFYFIVKQKE